MQALLWNLDRLPWRCHPPPLDTPPLGTSGLVPRVAQGGVTRSTEENWWSEYPLLPLLMKPFAGELGTSQVH